MLQACCQHTRPGADSHAAQVFSECAQVQDTIGLMNSGISSTVAADMHKKQGVCCPCPACSRPLHQLVLAGSAACRHLWQDEVSGGNIRRQLLTGASARLLYAYCQHHCIIEPVGLSLALSLSVSKLG